MDGHADTVKALRPQWREKTNGGIDSYDGLVDLARVDRPALRGLLGYLPPDDEWEHLLFGRGSADQLAGVVSQIVATKILLELAPEGALRGVIVRSYATAAEEDNDGGGPLYLMGHVLPGAPPELVPDVVILTEGTGDSKKGALGIYRGQRGRMQIEVVVTGRSCHGSMPWEGLNPLEHGGAIVAEAARRYDAREGFLDHPFLGHGTRTASWARLDTPSDCAVPERLTFRFDRRLTIGETPEQAVRDVEALDAVRAARAAGLQVEVGGPALPREDLARLPGRQPADLPGLADARGPPGDPRRGRGLPRRRHAPRRRAAGRRAGGRAAQGAARRPLDLLDRRRRLPDPGRRPHDRGAGGEALGRLRRREAPGHVRDRRRHRAEHPPHRRVRGPARAAARDRGAGPLPERVRGDGGLIQEAIDPNPHHFYD